MLFGRFASNRNEARYPTLWDGLVGAWCPSIQNPSGNRLYDLSGRANHGTLTNMDAATDWVRSGGHGALDFDNVDDRVAISYRPELDITGNVSFFCWSNPTSLGTPNVNHVWGGYNPSSPFSGIGFDTGGATGGTATLCVWDGTAWRNGTNNVLTTNVWQHIGFTIAGNALTFWVNGRSAGTATCAARTSYVGARAIGARADGGVPYAGQLDDIRIYNRALSPAEIRLLAAQRGIAFTPVRRVRANTVSSGPFLRRFQRSQALIGGGVI